MQGNTLTASGRRRLRVLKKEAPKATPGSFRTPYQGRVGAKAGQPGYLLVEGPVKEDGSAKLSANGIVASRQYARGVFAHEGGNYSYNIKATFKEATGSGVRDEGLGIVGRPCTFDFVKQ